MNEERATHGKPGGPSRTAARVARLLCPPVVHRDVKPESAQALTINGWPLLVEIAGMQRTARRLA